MNLLMAKGNKSKQSVQKPKTMTRQEQEFIKNKNMFDERR